METLSDQPPPKHQPMVPSLPVPWGWSFSHLAHAVAVSVAGAVLLAL